eukprot:4903608-Amphidinium_carterae.1
MLARRRKEAEIGALRLAVVAYRALLQGLYKGSSIQEKSVLTRINVLGLLRSKADQCKRSISIA